MRFVFTFILIGFIAVPAFAEGVVVPAGSPHLFGSSPFGTISEENMVDIYTRQIEYAEERQEFRASMQARRESYVRPRREAFQQYQNNLSVFNQRRRMDFTDLSQ